MKKIVLVSLLLSQTIFAQHKKKVVKEIPLAPQIEAYKIPEDRLLNGTLKGTKWYFDLKNYEEKELFLDKDKTKPDVLYFVDANKFQMNINQKNCKSLIKGTYQIMKMNDESTTVQKGHQPFKITSPYQKCIAKLSGFLSGALDISLNETGEAMEIKEGESEPALTLPGF
ncbi:MULTISPECIES: hypothetical protein [Chryseobacterium]|uniref:Uncharacterized protein n=1 Tax=Chryseobacterium geocarposphaerae TaxID=1416776 RepID=A0ABU1LB20_9FLAO|nr:MULTISPECIES: hypothetical protein [Chryseobacterium]MDR6403917.1 hypothetical protein [Chryseobacterium geocarposphaerae]MDR6698564.1 hypothetical protein [Chryseobacterium ginsenosidimutans]